MKQELYRAMSRDQVVGSRESDKTTKQPFKKARGTSQKRSGSTVDILREEKQPFEHHQKSQSMPYKDELI